MMKMFRTIYALIFLYLFILNGTASADIVEIVVEGNDKVASSNILSKVGTKVLTEIDKSQISRDVKSIFSLGFFQSVEAQIYASDFGTNQILKFIVVERPSVRKIKVTGNYDVKTSKILEKLELSDKKFVDRKKIELAVDEVLKLYQEKGFYGTKIDYSISDLGKSEIDIALDIEEGRKKVIRKIKFEGNKKFRDGELRSLIQSKEYSWWKSWATGAGSAKKENFSNDIQLLKRHYFNNGYIDVDISEADLREEKNDLELVYKINEGIQFKVGSLAAKGDLLDNSEVKTLEGIEVKSGDVFNVESLRTDTFKISEKYTDIGYAFANVEPLTRIDREASKVDLTFNVDKGVLTTVNRISVSGNDKTRDNVIRRSLKIDERETYSSSKIKRSEELVKRLGLFEEVSIVSVPTKKDGEVDLDVSVREGSTGSFSAGAGFSSGEGFILSSTVTEQNLFGTGRSATVDISTGTQRENLLFRINDPRISDTQVSGGVEVLSLARQFDDFTRYQTGGGFSLGYPLWFLDEKYLDDIRFSFEYQYLNVNIDKIQDSAPIFIKEEQGKSTSSSITPKLIRNTIDNPLDPSSGSRQILSYEYAGLGGDQKFGLLNISNSLFLTMLDTTSGPIVFSQRTHLGYGKTRDGDRFPLFRRFFAGGINSIRGYDAREVGPKDENNNEYGGSKELVANFEIIFPVLSSAGIRGVLFYDAGNAFDDEETIQISELRQAIGWGVRWKTPIAPIRIEIGYPLDKQTGDSSVVTNFSFGAPL